MQSGDDVIKFGFECAVALMRNIDQHLIIAVRLAIVVALLLGEVFQGRSGGLP